MERKKVFVSGCFDTLHSGHIKFLESAAIYGDLYVGIESDKIVSELKGRRPFHSEEERRYVLEALKNVKVCHINQGFGIIDFAKDLKRISPHYFIVDEEGNTPAKAELCRHMGINYIVLKPNPHRKFPSRHTFGLGGGVRHTVSPRSFRWVVRSAFYFKTGSWSCAHDLY